MLDTYGLHELVWDACDERFGDIAREQHDGLCPCGLSYAPTPIEILVALA